MSTQFSIGQMNQLADTLERVACYTQEDVTDLRNSRIWHGIRLVLSGQAEILGQEQIISQKPYVPEGYKVDYHDDSRVKFDPVRLGLYISEFQKNGRLISGRELLDELRLESVPILNACVLDYLMANNELIPRTWRKDNITVLFPGTIFSRRRALFFPCLYSDFMSYWRGLVCLNNDVCQRYRVAIISEVS